MSKRRGAGYDKLWGWFGLSYASFCVMPRILMHEMPDEWQSKMADLLAEYDATFQTSELPACKVTAIDDNGKFSRWPDWLLHYRRPDLSRVDELRYKPCEECGKLSHECPCIDALIAKTSAAIDAERTASGEDL
jgi:hypothetical protein